MTPAPFKVNQWVESDYRRPGYYQLVKVVAIEFRHKWAGQRFVIQVTPPLGSDKEGVWYSTEFFRKAGQ